jgi:hypothetical protein
MHACMHTYMHAYIHTYIHTYIHIYTYIQTYIHTYLHPYIHPYIHTHSMVQDKGKGKVVPVPSKHHAIKTYWKSGGIAPRILDLGTR